MTLDEAVMEVRRMLNDLEVKGSKNVALLCKSLSFLETISDYLNFKKEGTKNDSEDKQGENV